MQILRKISGIIFHEKTQHNMQAGIDFTEEITLVVYNTKCFSIVSDVDIVDKFIWVKSDELDAIKSTRSLDLAWDFTRLQRQAMVTARCYFSLINEQIILLGHRGLILLICVKGCNCPTLIFFYSPTEMKT